MFKKILFMGVVLLGLVGCASNAEHENMIYAKKPEGFPRNKMLIDNITLVPVTGGQETNPLWLSQVDNGGLERALRLSLQRVGLYGDANHSKYVLNAQLMKLQQPVVGFAFTVTSQIYYTLLDKKTNRVIYNRNIIASHTTAMSEQLIGVLRIKAANEGAVRDNIKQLIDDLFHLE